MASWNHDTCVQEGQGKCMATIRPAATGKQRDADVKGDSDREEEPMVMSNVFRDSASVVH